jgi:hypothetical protein
MEGGRERAEGASGSRDSPLAIPCWHMDVLSGRRCGLLTAGLIASGVLQLGLLCPSHGRGVRDCDVGQNEREAQHSTCHNTPCSCVSVVYTGGVWPTPSCPRHPCLCSCRALLTRAVHHPMHACSTMNPEKLAKLQSMARTGGKVCLSSHHVLHTTHSIVLARSRSLSRVPSSAPTDNTSAVNSRGVMNTPRGHALPRG